jgi:hypothetical protein
MPFEKEAASRIKCHRKEDAFAASRIYYIYLIASSWLWDTSRMNHVEAIFTNSPKQATFNPL